MSVNGDPSDHPLVDSPARSQPAHARAALPRPTLRLQAATPPARGHRSAGSPWRLVYRVDAAASVLAPCGTVAGIEIRGVHPAHLLDLTVRLAQHEVYALASVTDSSGHVSSAGEILRAMAAYGRSPGDGLYVDLEGALQGSWPADLSVCLSIRAPGERPPPGLALHLRMRQGLNVRNGLFAAGTRGPR